MRTLRFSAFVSVAVLAALGAGCPYQPAPPANGDGDGVSTSFEFTDLSGEFTLGTAPRRVTFSGGEARTVGVQALYHTGDHAWLMRSGETGEITFETPTLDLELFIRDQSDDTNGILTLFNGEGEVLATIQSTEAQWTRVVWPEDAVDADAVARITFENTGAVGLASLDDFSCCGEQDGDQEPVPLDDPIAEGIAASTLQIRLTTITTDLTAPNWGISPPGDPDRLAVTDQDGILWMVGLMTGEKTVFLDVSDRLVQLGIDGPGTFDERGLLGVAFAPDYSTSGLLYTYTSEPAAGEADFSTIPAGESANHQSVVTEWRVPDPAVAGSVVDPTTARELLRLDEPQFNHNGGAVNFGPDGRLYISIGDGGQADDQGTGHGPDGNGQDTTTVLGKLIRIDPLGDNSANGRYGIPADNPFVDDAESLGEIFAYGFRNPFRFSFDMQTGDLWLADVGQNDIEEVNLVEAGGNFGWNVKEGTFFFDPNGDGDGFVTAFASGAVPPDLIDPVAQYDHDEGIAVIGGFVYRGDAIAALQGRYVFADLFGRVFHLDENDEIREFSFQDGDLQLSILGFGEDGRGNIYLLANTTGVPFESTGMVLRLDPPIEDN